MKRKLVYLVAIIAVIAIGTTSFVMYSSSDNGTDTSAKSYNITVSLKACKDLYCLDQCDTCWIRVYRQSTLTTLGLQAYNGSCTYNFTVNASDVCALLEWVPSCDNLFSDNGLKCQNVSIYPDIEIDPTCY